MRLKELRGLPVIDPTAARKIGTVANYQVDPAAGTLAALDINGVQDGTTDRIAAQRIRRVGRNAVILTAGGGPHGSGAPEVNERWLDETTLVGLEVMGDDGNRVGRLQDATFNQDSLTIDSYLLQNGGLSRILRRDARIQPSRVQSCSRELMMVSAGRRKEVATISEPEVATERTEMVSVRVPLKAEDRLPAPSFEAVPESQPVVAHRG